MSTNNKSFVSKTLKFLHIKVSSKTEKLLIQVFRFGIVGGMAFLIDFVFLTIFKELCHFPLLLANTLSFTISVLFNYFASVKWVFDVNKEKSVQKQFILFIILSIVGLLLNDLIMSLGTEQLNWHYMLVKILATFIVMVFNFITRKIFRVGETIFP